MGIAYFPEVYPDELVYSVLARYYVHGGYSAYIFCAADVFVNKRVSPDKEFVNALKPEVLESLCRKMTMAELVERHTMFPYYARFLPCERRSRAFEALCSMSGDYNNLLAIPKQKNGENRYLRYCPLCVEKDRQLYGESYWHRSHQLTGVSVCSKHGIKLWNSSVIISGKASPNLVTAEQEIKEQNVICGNEIEIQLAEYVGKVFRSDMDMKNPVAVGQFLHSQMAGTEYLSVRGEQRNIQTFYEDFSAFYEELPEQGLTELWQIQKVFNNYRLNCFEVCQIAIFLNIPVEKLCNMELPEKAQEQIFDDKVRELRNQGLKYPEIAKRLNASYNVVKPVGGGRYGKYDYRKEIHQKCGAKPKDWDRIDRESFPSVKTAVRQLWGSGDERPHRVTEFAVCKILGFPDKRLALMPLCRAEVLKYQESQEQYWARELVWTVHKIQKEGKILNWKQVRTLTNMRKDNVLVCLPYLKVIAEPELYELVQTLL